MESERKVACVILAAGMAKRFGSTKQLAKLGKSGQTLVQTAVEVANGSKAAYVILVLGHDSSAIAADLKLGRTQIVLNKEFESGLSSSIRAAVANMPADCKAAIFMVADQPNLTAEILDRLINCYYSSLVTGKQTPKIFALTENSEPKNPMLIVSDLFPALQNLKGDVGAREIVRTHRNELTLVKIDDPRVFLDIDVFPK